MLQVVPMAEHLRVNAGVAVLLGVSGLDPHTNGTVRTPRLYRLKHVLERKVREE
jgi:hypothetical protein